MMVIAAHIGNDPMSDSISEKAFGDDIEQLCSGLSAKVPKVNKK